MEPPKWQPLGDIEFERTDCPVCGGAQFEVRFQKRIRAHVMRYVVCGSCETLYANPRVTARSLRGIYASREFFEGGEDNINYYSFLAGESYLSRTAASRLSRLARFAPGRDLLEVAPAAGFFLNQAKRQGFRVQGVEFSEPMAQYASRRWEVPVQSGSIEEIDLPAGSFDIIASWGVFTILRDPVAVLQKFAKALRSGGVLALNTYYHDGLWAKIWRSNWYILVLNTSQIFSRRTLKELLTSNGFAVVSRRRDAPYASLKYLTFQMASHIPGVVETGILRHLDALDQLIVRVPAPDNYEYICVKQ
jgi:2-polyprenyl-3-methyl-5-hydroxy-6-metoxy-1,4-benzoquinol methylase